MVGVRVTLNEIAAAKHEMHKFYGLVRALLYTELNLSKVQRGAQSIDLISLGWLEVTMPEGSTMMIDFVTSSLLKLKSRKYCTHTSTN